MTWVNILAFPWLFLFSSSFFSPPIASEQIVGQHMGRIIILFWKYSNYVFITENKWIFHVHKYLQKSRQFDWHDSAHVIIIIFVRAGACWRVLVRSFPARVCALCSCRDETRLSAARSDCTHESSQNNNKEPSVGRMKAPSPTIAAHSLLPYCISEWHLTHHTQTGSSYLTVTRISIC